MDPLPTGVTPEETTTSEGLNNPNSILIVAAVILTVIFIVLIVCYNVVVRSKIKLACRRSRKRKDSETSDIYNNTHTSKRSLGDSIETLENRPLPQTPVKTTPLTDTNDDYLQPVSPFWKTCKEEILHLPPAPPVFPPEFANAVLEGENAYLQVISDDAPLLPPRPPLYEINTERQSLETDEKYGYLEPMLLHKPPLKQSSTKIDQKMKITKDNEDGKSMEESIVVATHWAQQHRPGSQPVMSEIRYSSVEDTSNNRTTQIVSETSNDSQGKIFRSSLQVHLSPPTSPRTTTVSTSSPTVVVQIYVSEKEQHDRQI